MINTPMFRKGERVLLEYEIDEKFLKDDQIYYTLKNPSNGTYLKGVAFTAEELIPMEDYACTPENNDENE